MPLQIGKALLWASIGYIAATMVVTAAPSWFPYFARGVIIVGIVAFRFAMNVGWIGGY